MIDPSLVEKLGIQGESSQLLLSTVNERDKSQQGLKVDFKIASLDNQGLGFARPHHSSQAPRSTESKHRAVINEYVDKGYARKLTPEEAARKAESPGTYHFTLFLT